MSWSCEELPVALRVPCHTRSLRVVRLVVAALAADLGYDYEQIEDLRIAADEIVSALMPPEESADGATLFAGPSVHIFAGARGGVMEVASRREHPGPEGERTKYTLDLLAAQIVGAIVESYEVESSGGQTTIAFRARPPSQPIG